MRAAGLVEALAGPEETAARSGGSIPLWKRTRVPSARRKYMRPSPVLTVTMLPPFITRPLGIGALLMPLSVARSVFR
jgi:hypothetical protein